MTQADKHRLAIALLTVASFANTAAIIVLAVTR